MDITGVAVKLDLRSALSPLASCYWVTYHNFVEGLDVTFQQQSMQIYGALNIWRWIRFDQLCGCVVDEEIGGCLGRGCPLPSILAKVGLIKG